VKISFIAIVAGAIAIVGGSIVITGLILTVDFTPIIIAGFIATSVVNLDTVLCLGLIP